MSREDTGHEDARTIGDTRALYRANLRGTGHKTTTASASQGRREALADPPQLADRKGRSVDAQGVDGSRNALLATSVQLSASTQPPRPLSWVIPAPPASSLALTGFRFGLGGLHGVCAAQRHRHQRRGTHSPRIPIVLPLHRSEQIRCVQIWQPSSHHHW